LPTQSTEQKKHVFIKLAQYRNIDGSASSALLAWVPIFFFPCFEKQTPKIRNVKIK